MTEVTLVNEDLYTTLPLLTKFSEREIPMKLAYAVGKVEAELVEAHKVIRKLHNKLMAMCFFSNLDNLIVRYISTAITNIFHNTFMK